MDLPILRLESLQKKDYTLLVDYRPLTNLGDSKYIFKGSAQDAFAPLHSAGCPISCDKASIRFAFNLITPPHRVAYHGNVVICICKPCRGIGIWGKQKLHTFYI